MSLSQREERLNRYSCHEIVFSSEKIAGALEQAVSEIDFAFLFGSGKDGLVSAGSDLDVAVFFDQKVKVDFNLITQVISVVEDLYTGLQCDLGILNTAGPVFRFEVLRGRPLFVRDNKLDEYAEFFSLTCREYEDAMITYERYYRNLELINLETAVAGGEEP